MAGLIAQFNTPEVALSAATAKTVIQVIAASNHRGKILGFAVSFDGITPTAEPVVVELLRQTTAGTVTSLTGVLVAPSGADETIQTTGGYNATAEPTAGDVLRRIEVHPQSGYEVLFPFGQEPTIPGGGRVGIRCTAPAAVNVVGSITIEE
jgi:hypothetical protein